jgi:uncharacterized membrane protein
VNVIVVLLLVIAVILFVVDLFVADRRLIPAGLAAGFAAFLVERL